MLDAATRISVAKSLEDLAAQDVWNEEVWQKCYNLVKANAESDEMAAYVLDDLMHYTGRSFLGSIPKPKYFNRYRPDFRDIATALRSGMSLADYKKYHG